MNLARYLFAAACLVQTAVAQDTPQALDAARFTGGLVVHLGCADGQRTVALHSGENCLVQGLDTSADAVRAARQRIADQGLQGQVTARVFDGEHLPFIDNTVNVLVVDRPDSVSGAEMIRVLCPDGTLCFIEDGAWKTTVKPRPDEIDEWTHYQYDSTGTMVGKDRIVGPPRRVQWVAEPKWLRNHEFMASMHALVSSGNRIFYIIDEGLRNHIFYPADWKLIARDAFNGKLLWKRDIKDWQTHIWPMKSGPGHMPRRLVAVGDTVYVTLGYDEPLTAVDAVTGETIRTYEGTQGTEEIVLDDGRLFLLTDPNKGPQDFTEATTSWGGARNRANTDWGWLKERPKRTVAAVDAASGEVLWKYESNVAPQTLIKGPGHVFLFDGDRIVALDPNTGQESWATDDLDIKTSPTTGYTHRMVYSDGVVIFCHTKSVNAFSADSGQPLWKGALHGTGHNSPNDIFVINGLVWSAATGKVQSEGTPIKALDLHTGEEVENFVAENFDVYFMHQRCYPGRATERYLMTSGTGTEFYEIGGEPIVDIHHYVRGSCIYGFMPCNGLMYKPPDSCACHYQSKVTNFTAMAPTGREARRTDDASRLEKGPAHGRPLSAFRPPLSDAWPTYRGNAERSGSTAAEVSADLVPGWTIDLGGKLSAMTIADGRAFVAAVDRHELYALDADTGQIAWTYTAGGRIDTPPTIYRGTALFGSADGSVYCVGADDGQLMWRYQVAPGEAQIVSYDQLESVWPVHGSVLVHDDTAYCLAGRNMFFDGGMRLVRLDPTTGKMLSETILDEIDPETGLNLQTKMPGKAMPVANPDVLTCDGQYVYMGAQKFDLAGVRVDVDAPMDKQTVQVGEGRHLFCPTGMLDGNWFHRSYMLYGLTGGEGHGEYATPPNITPSGRLLVYDDDRVYGFRASVYNNTMQPRPDHFLFAAIKDVEIPPEAKGKASLQYAWQVETSGILPNAMALAGTTLFHAGPPDVVDEGSAFGTNMELDSEITRALRSQDEAWRGSQGATLHAVSTSDGQKQAEYALTSIPVWDGLAVASGRVFLALQDGTVVCLKSK